MTARLAFLGDTLLGGTAQDILDGYGAGYPLSAIQHLWADADLVVANHEGPLTRREAPADKANTGKKRYWYKGTPESAQALAARRNRRGEPGQQPCVRLRRGWAVRHDRSP